MAKSVCVLGEYSGVIRDAFIRKGYNAISVCDEPSDSNFGPHILGDFYSVLFPGMWDLIVAHPTCTCVCCSGNSTYREGKPKHQMRLDSIKYTEKLWFDIIEVCPKVALENPQGVLSTQSKMGKATQYIQPYEFGNPYRKKTGLWLHNLPKLVPTNVVKPHIVTNSDGSTFSADYGWSTNKRGRSITYPGIAEAMVDQWGGII